MPKMVDIETMALTSRALVLSVAVVGFEMLERAPTIEDRSSSFFATLDTLEQLVVGRRVDAQTQRWWADQNSAARANLTSRDPTKASHFSVALDSAVGDSVVWANGAHFDIAILESYLDDFGWRPPWPYNAVRDARTIYKSCRKRQQADPEVYKNLVPHDPYDDCVSQIWGLWEHWDFTVPA